MPTLSERLRRNYRDANYFQAFKRGFDDKPMQCSLYVTDNCNLDCEYCSEYDNSVPHPPLADVKAWLSHIRALGTLRVALVGGEPLTHPDIVEITRYAKELGFSTSLTTNGFLLTETLIRDLEDAGLEVMQLSIDRVTPSAVTKKSLKSVAKKIEMMRESRIKLHITGVICADTLDECEEVLEYGLARGIPTEIRLVHADPEQIMRVDPGGVERRLEILRDMKSRKRGGEKVHTSEAILDYQIDLLEGRNTSADWVCTGGYKLFFVSAKGHFMECSMRPTPLSILDITPEDLKSYHKRKSCQDGCGVYCVVSASKFSEHPWRFLGKEIAPRLRQSLGEIRERAPA